MNYNSIDKEAKKYTSDFLSRVQHQQVKPKINRNTDSDEDGGKTPDAIKTESPSVEGNDFQS